MKSHQLDDVLFVVVTISIAAVAGLGIWSAIDEAREWQAFFQSHDCRVVSKMKGDTLTTWGAGADGKGVFGVTSTPDKTAWLCDDGITYWR